MEVFFAEGSRIRWLGSHQNIPRDGQAYFLTFSGVRFNVRFIYELKTDKTSFGDMSFLQLFRIPLTREQMSLLAEGDGSLAIGDFKATIKGKPIADLMNADHSSVVHEQSIPPDPKPDPPPTVKPIKAEPRYSAEELKPHWVRLAFFLFFPLGFYLLKKKTL